MRFTIYILLTALTFSFGCNSKLEHDSRYEQHQYYKLTGKQTGYIANYEKDFHAFGVQLDLTTDYDTLPPLHFMSCSWADALGRTSDTTFYIGYHSCDANFEYFQHITSKDTLRFLSIIATPNEKKFDGKYLRVGISLIDTLMAPIEDSLFSSLYINNMDKGRNKYYEMLNDPENIVWSNPILLTKMDQPITHSGRVELICGKETTHEHCR